MGLYKPLVLSNIKKIKMGKHCALCCPLQCENWKVHHSKKPEDIAYCNVVRASRYAEEYKADVKAGREPEELEYGTLDMEEGPAKEAAKADGVALAARCAQAREAHFAKKMNAGIVEKAPVPTIDAKLQNIDAELRAILVEHQVEEQAWRLESTGIMRKSDLQKIWSGDENLFGEDAYSRGSLEILKKSLHEYGLSGAAGGNTDVSSMQTD